MSKERAEHGNYLQLGCIDICWCIPPAFLSMAQIESHIAPVDRGITAEKFHIMNAFMYRLFPCCHGVTQDVQGGHVAISLG